MGNTTTMSRKDQVIEQFKRIFDAIDKDKSGGLDKKEVMNFVKDIATAMGESDSIPKDPAEIEAGLAEMFKELDTDGDGQISFDEMSKGEAEAGQVIAGIEA